MDVHRFVVNLLLIYELTVLYCNCQTATLTPIVPDVIESHDLTFTCTVSTAVTYVNWTLKLASTTSTSMTSMGVQNGKCALQQTSSILHNTTKYSYTCNSTVYQVTVKNVQRGQHNNVWSCFPQGQSSGPELTINVQVPVASVSITPASTTLDVLEKTVQEFTCQTSASRPDASVTWYKVETGVTSQINQNITSSTTNDDFSITNSSLRFVPSRQQVSVQIFCKAENTVNTSPEQSDRITLNVLHPPSMLSLYFGSLSGTLISERLINVVNGDKVIIECKANDGNPEPTITWNGQNSDNPLLTLQVQESLTSKTCTATNTMVETDGNVENGSVSDTISFNVLILPTISECTFYYIDKPNNVINITETLMVMEHVSFTLGCSAVGTPALSISWYLPASTTATTKSVTINEVTRDEKGNYVFYASSTLRPSYQDARDITVNKSITVEVLFPPVVKTMATIYQLEGSRLNYDCPFTEGFPTKNIFQWSRSVDTMTWNNRQLSISNITKRDAGNYQCKVSNTMQPTGDTQTYTGSDAKSFYLNVLYKASITSFAIDGFTENVVTANETSPDIHFKCDVDSYPLAVITLKNRHGILKSVTSITLGYTIESPTCLDSGTYTCSARNEHNKEDVPTYAIQLSVNCSPRPGDEVDKNITGEINQTNAFTFYVIAYPVPTFTWWKLVQENWTQLETNDRYMINSFELKSVLVIHKLTFDDFTSYKVVAKNNMGHIEHTYFLNYLENEYHTTPTKDSISILPIVGYSVGATSVCFILIILTVLLVWRFCLRKAEKVNEYHPPKSDTINTKSEGNIVETGRHNSIGSSYYETLEGNNQDASNCVVTDTTTAGNTQNKEVYENMLLQ